MASGDRFSDDDLHAWRTDGVALIRDFFTPEEVAAVCTDFDVVFGRPSGADEPMVRKKPDQIGGFSGAQFKTFEAVPFDCSPALNLIGVHPALVTFAKAALKCDAVHLYQCQAWAKFAGDADYDQPFHTDFANHTLTAPAQDAHLNSVTILCYFSDVTAETGAMNFVTRPDSLAVAGPEASLSRDPAAQATLQAELVAQARSSASPAGSIVPYGIDIFHRGTNITAPGGYRYALMTCFKAAGNDAIGFHAWAFHHLKPWSRIFDHATPEQLACFGVPLPGAAFWTETTLARTQARYPGWDAGPYRRAMRTAA